MTKIDTTKPLEAVHTASGRVVPVTFAKNSTTGGFYTKECPDPSTTNNIWAFDGSDWCSMQEWTIRNVAAPIDPSKPLQLNDGTPVTLTKVSPDGRFNVIIPVGHAMSTGAFFGGSRQFHADGTRDHHMVGHHDVTLQNVPEPAAAKLDPSKPMQLSDGTAVTLKRHRLNGEIVVIVPYGHTGGGARTFNADGTRSARYGVLRGVTLTNISETPVNQLNLFAPLVTRSGLPVTYLATANNQLLVEINYGGFTGKQIERRNLNGGEVRTSTGTTRGGTSFEYAGDVINKVTTTRTFFNVYDDGASSSGHATYETAANYSKVGRTRVGILEVVKSNGVTTSTAFTALVPHLRRSSSAPSVATKL